MRFYDSYWRRYYSQMSPSWAVICISRAPALGPPLPFATLHDVFFNTTRSVVVSKIGYVTLTQKNRMS